ncbi:Bidirectional sugar transporter SWEET12 [Vitis vinifera]|uniref:Bidirectional sugar transporter SWEET n=1 Tax=Vitis vinifera TaxID=29760 RepID=A0A438EY80_VITVI|nr:Bidirectional sugar transporter SWEET12 [Vitis vinifera]
MAMFTVGHHPWVFASGILGNLMSFLVYLAPIPTFTRVIKKKSTEGFQSVPYVIALFSAMLWMYYGLVNTNASFLLSVNGFGCFIEIIYISIYLIFAPRRARILTLRLLLLINLGAFCLILIVTNFMVKRPHRVKAVGWVCLIFARLVIRTKSVEFMPLPLSICLTLSAVGWFFYGILQMDLYIAMPNTLGFVFGLIQMILYAMYRNSTPVTKEPKLPEQVIDIVKLNTNSTPEVHPVSTLQPNCVENEGGNGQNARKETEHAEESMGGSNRV